MANNAHIHANFLRRKIRVRTRLAEQTQLPRLSVHRSLRHMYAQIIDDQTGTTLVSSSDAAITAKGNKTEIAKAVGANLAELAKAKKITAVRFDRGGFKYHGRVAALAEAAREGGLSF